MGICETASKIAAFSPVYCELGKISAVSTVYRIKHDQWSVASALQEAGEFGRSKSEPHSELHCALATRYIRYIVVNQQLNPLQIGYRPVTPVTPLSISNLHPVPVGRVAQIEERGSVTRSNAKMSNDPRIHEASLADRNPFLHAFGQHAKIQPPA